MSTKIIKNHKKNKKAGFSIFLAVIVTGVLLIVAFSVSYLSSKELSFSGVNRNSQYAIFAADAGTECALYWDAKEGNDLFATSSASGNSISCAGQTINDAQPLAGTTTLSRIGGGGDTNPVSVLGFYLTASDTSGPCAIVTINKYFDGPDLITHIHSYGYNTCDTAPQRVERGIEVKY